MKKIDVFYNGGESRQNAGKACDYMIAKIPDGEFGVEAPFLEDYTELYAEILLNDETPDDDTSTFYPLKEEIIRQAKGLGLSEEVLNFD